MNYDSLLEVLKQNADEKYKQFNDGIVNGGVSSFGCRMPVLRKIAKSVTLQDALAYPVHQWLEVDMIVGMAIASAKLPFAEKSPLLWQFAETIDNWAVSDCNTFNVPKSEADLYFDLFSQMVRSDKPFVCRYGVVCLMSNFLDEAHIDEIFSLLSQITVYGHYYVDMGVAWLVATSAAKCRDKTFDYLGGKARADLNVFTYNKALQKMRDSYRISAEDKEKTYTLKR